MLAVIVVSHLFLSIPGNITIMLAVLRPKWYILSSDTCLVDPLILTLVNVSHMLYVANYAINFILYCLGNKDVRLETFRLLRDWKDVIAKVLVQMRNRIAFDSN